MNAHPPASPPPDTGTTLAVERTRIAYERTMMAWIRTATSLITFGFSVYKFFGFELKKDPQATPMLVGPRGFGLTLIGIGLLSLVLGAVDHARDLGALRRQYPGMPMRSKAGLVALAVGALGVLAMVAAFLNA
jgi:putative membrane protein